MLCNIWAAQPLSKMDKTLGSVLQKTLYLNSQSRNTIIKKDLLLKNAFKFPVGS